MNDIERLAATIRENRRNTVLSKPSTEEIDIELTGVARRQQVASLDLANKKSSNTANDKLLHDLDTEFGLASGDANTNSSVDHGKSKHTFAIPIEKLVAANFITPGTERGLSTEQYRRIKRPILRNLDRTNNNGIPNNVVVVTSSVSGEGKTFTAINLAMSLALERERTVLLVDADVLKGSASSILELGEGRLGLTDLLSGSVQDPSQVILRTNIANFTYLPAGSAMKNANELLSSARMKRLFDELSSRYNDRIILMDCPPLLQTNEAHVIADYAGQIIFVVAEEETSQRFVLEALNQIPKDRYVGIVLNKSHNRILGNDYGYTYNYA